MIRYSINVYLNNFSSDFFNEERVSHQVKYLGLMENLRVRRAGFAYRRAYEIFLERYKSLCPSTWPSYKGQAKDGVLKIVKHLNYHADDYRMGRLVYILVSLYTKLTYPIICME